MKSALAALMAVLLLFTARPAAAAEKEAAVSPPEEGSLYAACAVLMDGESGRILYEKNGREARPMASTTKLLTCILALEALPEDTQVTASAQAVSQPAVRLGMREGERYLLSDLLYSLMLESHNDTAVAVAEAVSGSVDDFAALMNQKAEEIGCKASYFITPNGLDAEKDGRRHSASAADMARIMRYCVMESPKREEFKRITGTASHSFSANGRSFSLTNHNALLTMLEGAFSGKTGFTGEAGYCYVGALEREGKALIVALLACGWPENKNYKWSDARTLFEYGLSAYEYRSLTESAPLLPALTVKNGVLPGGSASDTPAVSLKEVPLPGSPRRFLMKSDEALKAQVVLPESLEAPVKAGQSVGRIYYELCGEEAAVSDIQAAASVERLTLSRCFSEIFRKFFINQG